MVSDAVAHGVDPWKVGSLVLEAIEHDQFWIFTDERVAQTALRQAELMAREHKLISLE